MAGVDGDSPQETGKGPRKKQTLSQLTGASTSKTKRALQPSPLSLSAKAVRLGCCWFLRRSDMRKWQ